MTDTITDIEKFKIIQQTAFELFNSKNADYGNAYKECGKVGLIVRMKDKINRYINISENGIHITNNEKLEDTILDLMNYCCLLLMLINDDKNKKVINFD